VEGRLHDVLRTSDTRVVVRFTTQANPAGSTVAGTNYFSFDPTMGQGYVLHCHILDHKMGKESALG